MPAATTRSDSGRFASWKSSWSSARFLGHRPQGVHPGSDVERIFRQQRLGCRLRAFAQPVPSGSKPAREPCRRENADPLATVDHLRSSTFLVLTSRGMARVPAANDRQFRGSASRRRPRRKSTCFGSSDKQGQVGLAIARSDERSGCSASSVSRGAISSRVRGDSLNQKRHLAYLRPPERLHLRQRPLLLRPDDAGQCP